MNDFNADCRIWYAVSAHSRVFVHHKGISKSSSPKNLLWLSLSRLLHAELPERGLERKAQGGMHGDASGLPRQVSGECAPLISPFQKANRYFISTVKERNFRNIKSSLPTRAFQVHCAITEFQQLAGSGSMTPEPNSMIWWNVSSEFEGERPPKCTPISMWLDLHPRMECPAWAGRALRMLRDHSGHGTQGTPRASDSANWQTSPGSRESVVMQVQRAWTHRIRLPLFVEFVRQNPNPGPSEPQGFTGWCVGRTAVNLM